MDVNVEVLIVAGPSMGGEAVDGGGVVLRIVFGRSWAAARGEQERRKVSVRKRVNRWRRCVGVSMLL